jgi:hypothetical protein
LAVFINEGKIADMFTEGMHNITTANLPILSTLQGCKYGFECSFKAEVYFVSTKEFRAQKFGTKNPFLLNDDRFGMIELRAFGTYAYKIEDPVNFIKNVSGTQGGFDTDSIYEYLRSLTVTRFTDAIEEINIPLEAFAKRAEKLSGIYFPYWYSVSGNYSHFFDDVMVVASSSLPRKKIDSELRTRIKHQIGVNGRTGEVQGERPLSILKITLAILLAFILIESFICSKQP